MAEVWAAQLLAAGGFCKSMVIKRVLPELASNPSFLRMLMTEARVAARLSHANICSVFELGDVEGEYYIAMEYLRGAPLTAVLEAGGALSVPLAVAVVAQACEGLHYAHEQRDGSGQLLGLVHRDVSPHNLFVTVDGIVKVLDFGIAKVDDGSSERTEAGKVKGKLAYMSPEQLAADQLDRRSDVWSLGVVLWELLTGKRLFTGGLGQTVDGIRNARVPALATAGVDCPALDEVLARSICRKEWRYQTAADLRKAMVSAIAPLATGGNDAVAQMVWARCGATIRTQDKRFEQVEASADPVMNRLPLRAEQTAVSKEVYVRDAIGQVVIDHGSMTDPLVDADAIDDEIDPTRLAGPTGKSRAGLHERAPTADTSPEIPVALEAAEAAMVRAEHAAAMQATADAAAAAAAAAVEIAVERGTWRRIALLVGAAVVAGMVIGVVLHVMRKPTPAPASAGSTLATAGEIGPSPAAATEIAPVAPVEPLAADREPAADTAAPKPTKRVKPPTPAIVKKADPPKRTKPDAEPPRRDPEPKRDPEPPKRTVKAEPGKLFVDARPWATIYVDGKKLGPTPILNATIPAGDHTIKAITEDGRSKSISVHVDAGETVRKKVLF